MKSTLKALRYTFIQINKPATWLIILGYFAICCGPTFLVLYDVSERKFDSLSLKIPMMSALNSVFLPMAFIFKTHTGGCKYHYSISFAKKLHTVVPVIFAFTLSTAICISYIALAGRGYGRASLAAVILFASTEFSLIGIVSSLCEARVRDFLIPFIIAIVFGQCLTDNMIRVVNTVFSVNYAIVTAVLIFALSITFTILYLNRLWNKKSRFIKIKTGNSYLYGK